MIYLCENKLKVRGRKEGTHREREIEREREAEREREKKKLGLWKLGYKTNLSSLPQSNPEGVIWTSWRELLHAYGKGNNYL